MLLLEDIGTIVFGLWIMSHGTGPGDSIMIVIGLPVVLFGVLLTIIGFARSMKEPTRDVSELGLDQPPKKYDLFEDSYKKWLVKNYGIEWNEALGKFICSNRLFPNIEDALSFADAVERDNLTREQKVSVRPEQKVQKQQSKRNTCPE